MKVRGHEPPPHLYFSVSAIFHYLGPSFAVLLFARVEVLGVAWLRIASAAVVFAIWRRPWRTWGRLDTPTQRLVIAWAVVLAAMNCCFYEAISTLPLGTVAAIEFLPVVALAAIGARTPRNYAALAFAVGGVYLLSRRAVGRRASRPCVRVRQRRAVRHLHRPGASRRRATRRSRASMGWRRRC